MRVLALVVALAAPRSVPVVALAALLAVPVVALAALLAVPVVVQAHEVLHEVRPGGAVALKAFEPGGEVLADAPYQVWSPADPGSPWQTGRTDRAGWLSFVPAVPGSWRVKVVEASGHGLDVLIDTATPAPPPAPAGDPGAAFVLRPLLGALLIGALFGGLVLLYRKKARR